jgi:hypothetical protein
MGVETGACDDRLRRMTKSAYVDALELHFLRESKPSHAECPRAMANERHLLTPVLCDLHGNKKIDLHLPTPTQKLTMGVAHNDHAATHNENASSSSLSTSLLPQLGTGCYIETSPSCIVLAGNELHLCHARNWSGVVPCGLPIGIKASVDLLTFANGIIGEYKEWEADKNPLKPGLVNGIGPTVRANELMRDLTCDAHYESIGGHPATRMDDGGRVTNLFNYEGETAVITKAASINKSKCPVMMELVRSVDATIHAINHANLSRPDGKQLKSRVDIVASLTEVPPLLPVFPFAFPFVSHADQISNFAGHYRATARPPQQTNDKTPAPADALKGRATHPNCAGACSVLSHQHCTRHECPLPLPITPKAVGDELNQSLYFGESKPGMCIPRHGADSEPALDCSQSGAYVTGRGFQRAFQTLAHWKSALETTKRKSSLRIANMAKKHNLVAR